MNILVLHGGHTVQSYNRLRQIIEQSKNRGWQIERISDGEPLSLPEMLTATSLFNDKTLYIVDSAYRLKSSELKWLKKNGQKIDAYLVIYSQNTITRNILNSLPKGYKIEEFKLPKLIWKFLDSFYPKNTKNCLKLLHQVTKQDPEEFVFALLARHLRDLYWVKADADGLPYPSWRISKLKSQSQKFANGQLREIISELADEDIKAKTSKINISDSLDFLIVTHLE